MGAFGGGFPCDPLIDPTCTNAPSIPIVVIVDTGVAAEVASLAALAGSIQSTVNIVRDVVGLVIKGIGAVLQALILIWSSILKPILKAIQKVIATLQHIIDKVLKPYLDWMRAMRKIILDIYNRFIRPWIVLIESVRRVIRIFQLLHIHVFDGLDRQLAKIEGKLLKPIFDLLRRTNTLGNWVSFILNARGFLTRGLLLGSLTQNRGGFVNTFYLSQTYGFTPLAPAPAPAAASQPQTFDVVNADVSLALVAGSAQFHNTAVSELVACLETPIGNVDTAAAVDELIRCITS